MTPIPADDPLRDGLSWRCPRHDADLDGSCDVCTRIAFRIARAALQQPAHPEPESGPPFMARHDLGCRCWPHVSEKDALELAVQTGHAEYMEARRSAALRADSHVGEDAGPGWWHPAACIDRHDEDHNCLDDQGSIIGWRDPVDSAALSKEQGRSPEAEG